MVRLHKSKIHEQHTVVFFRGLTPAESGPFIFAESRALFGEEILGPNVFEFDSPEFRFDLREKDLRQRTGIPPGLTMGLIEAGVTAALPGYDLEIEYTANHLETIAVAMLKHALVALCQFKIRFTERAQLDRVVLGLDEKTTYLKVTFSKDFITERSHQLGPLLQRTFNPNRYVDSQVPMFMLMTTLSGHAAAMDAEKAQL